MRRSVVIVLAVGLLLLSAPLLRAEDEYEDDDDDEEAGGEEKDVIVLTSTNFEKILTKSKFALVEFYAPWCGHCKTLKPHYAAAATTLKAYDAAIVIGKVDATEQPELAKKFGVTGYPSLKWFVDGELAMDYNGGRDEEGLVNWVRKKTGPVTITVEDVEALTALEAEHVVLVVGFFKAFEGAAYEDFKGVAQKVEDVAFVQTTSAVVAAAAGLEAVKSIGMIRNFKGSDRDAVQYSGESVAEFQAWVKAEKMPLSIEFNPANSDKIFNSGIQLQILLWAKAADMAPGAELHKVFESVAAKFKGRLVFVTINNEGESHEPVTNFFGLAGAESPQVMGFFMEKNKKYKFTGAVTAEALEVFATSVADGTVQPDLKSAEIPTSPDDKDGHVQIIVGKSVNAIVKDPTKDVLLEVYAPWCGHCKKLDPIYRELAAKFAGVDSIVIAKMDGTDNEHPDIDVKGFPTIFFFPAGEDNKPYILEDVERTVEGFTAFLEKNAKVAFTLSAPEEADAGSTPVPEAPSGKDEL